MLVAFTEPAQAVEPSADQAGCERTAYEAAEDPADASTDAAAKRTEQGELAGMQQHAHEAGVAEQRVAPTRGPIQQPRREHGAQRAERCSAKHAARDAED